MESHPSGIQERSARTLNHPKDVGNFPKGARDVLHRLERIAFDRLLKLQFRQQYQEALEVLCETMQNPDREREVVWKRLSKLKTSGRPAPEHLPTLIKLERITRETGGTAYVEVDKTVFEELARINHPETIPVDFLLEAFRYRRRYDNFARRRSAYAVELAATIAAQTDDVEALDALVEMLSDPKADIRGKAMVTLYNTYEWQGCKIPPILLDRLWDAARNDRSRKVRQTALAVLQRVGKVSHEEAMEYLEEK